MPQNNPKPDIEAEIRECIRQGGSRRRVIEMYSPFPVCPFSLGYKITSEGKKTIERKLAAECPHMGGEQTTMREEDRNTFWHYRLCLYNI